MYINNNYLSKRVNVMNCLLYTYDASRPYSLCFCFNIQFRHQEKEKKFSGDK